MFSVGTSWFDLLSAENAQKKRINPILKKSPKVSNFCQVAPIFKVTTAL